MFRREIYIKRRAELCKNMRDGLGIFFGNELLPITYKDNCYNFSQDSTFLYYFGIKRDGLIGVIDFSTGETYISGKDYSMNDIVWMGDQPTILEMGEKAGIENFIDKDEIKKIIDKNNKEVLFTAPYSAQTTLQLSDVLDINVKDVERLSSVKLHKEIIKQRNIKSEEEIKEMEKAVNITREMHKKAYEVVKAGIYEYEIKAEIEKIAAKYGCETSFHTIATARGETLHNHYSGNLLKDGDLFLLDCGAKLENGYCGDMTSVIPVSGKFTEKQRAIYNILLEMYDRAVLKLKIGTKYSEAYIEASRTLLEGLRKLELIHGEIEEMLEKSVHAMFFPHGLGHMLGLDAHDCENLGEDFVGYGEGEKRDTRPGFKSMRLTRKIEEGFVFTVEPGIYFIPKLIDEWERENKCKEYINFEKVREYIEVGGMRYEWDFAATKNGIKRLGENLPKSAEEIENTLKLK